MLPDNQMVLAPMAAIILPVPDTVRVVPVGIRLLSADQEPMAVAVAGVVGPIQHLSRQR
jgi:hypothetical protein